MVILKQANKWGDHLKGRKKKSAKRRCERGRENNLRQITCNRKHRQTWPELCLSGLAVSYSFGPPWDHFHPLWVKRKPGWKWKVTQAKAQALGVREEKIPAARALLLFKAPAIVSALIQAHCCAEISRAPFGSLRLQRHAADPLVVLSWDTWLDRCMAPATITTSCGPLPSLPLHSIVRFLFLQHSLLFSSRTISGQHSYSFISLSFVLLLFFLLWCICLLFFGAPSLPMVRF